MTYVIRVKSIGGHRWLADEEYGFYFWASDTNKYIEKKYVHWQTPDIDRAMKFATKKDAVSFKNNISSEYLDKKFVVEILQPKGEF